MALAAWENGEEAKASSAPQTLFGEKRRGNDALPPSL